MGYSRCRLCLRPFNLLKFFADTSPFSILQNPNTTADDRNHDLNLINQWVFQWEMSFNPDPNKQAVHLICEKKDHPKIYSGPVHINEKDNTARKGLGIIKHLPPYIPVSTLEQIYKIYVRPHLDFYDAHKKRHHFRNTHSDICSCLHESETTDIISLDVSLLPTKESS